jgi:hypothetical protein
VLGDGSTWIWNTATELFRKIIYGDGPESKLCIHARYDELDGGRLKSLLQLKRAGMHWTAKGASTLIALRCRLSGRFEDFWERRSDQGETAA